MEEGTLKRILHSDYCEDFLRQEGIYVRLENMPEGAPAVTMYDGEKEEHNVYLNARLSRERNQISFDHEILQHIAKQDWHSDKSVEEIEFAARKGNGQIL